MSEMARRALEPNDAQEPAKNATPSASRGTLPLGGFKSRRLGWLAGLTVALVAGVGGTALALWLAQGQTAPLLAQKATIGFAVTKDAVSDAASSSADPVQFTIGQAEAATLVADGPDANGDFAVAVPFDLTMLTSAGYGMDYSIAMDAAQAGTVFGLPGTQVFFPVDDPANCTVAAADTATPYQSPDPVTGIAGGGNLPQTQVDHWCLVVTVTPSTYSPNVVASGTNVVEDPEATAAGADGTWSAYVIPDPALEPNLAVTITPLPQAAGAS